MNEQLTTLVAMQKAAQANTAMSFLGSTATVDGSTTSLRTAPPPGASGRQARHRHDQHQECNRRDSPIRGSYPCNAGRRISSGTAAATTAAMAGWRLHDVGDRQGRERTAVAVSTEIARRGDGVDLTQDPADAVDRRPETSRSTRSTRGPLADLRRMRDPEDCRRVLGRCTECSHCLAPTSQHRSKSAPAV